MDFFVCTSAIPQPLSSNQIEVTQQNSVIVKLVYAAQLWASIGVLSERLSQAAAAFDEILVGIIQVAGLKDKIDADRFAELKAIPFSQKVPL